MNQKRATKKTAVKKSTKTKVPENAVVVPDPKTKQGDLPVLLNKMIHDIARSDSQLQYLSRSLTNFNSDVNDEFGYLRACLKMLFDASGMEMPAKPPKILDAQVELTEALDEGEVCEFKASYSNKEHPVYGHYQAVIGNGEEASVRKLESMHPIVQKRIREAFEKLKAEPHFKEDFFYFVRLGIVHAQPLTDHDVLLRKSEEKPEVQGETTNVGTH